MLPDRLRIDSIRPVHAITKKDMPFFIVIVMFTTQSRVIITSSVVAQSIPTSILRMSVFAYAAPVPQVLKMSQAYFTFESIILKYSFSVFH